MYVCVGGGLPQPEQIEAPSPSGSGWGEDKGRADWGPPLYCPLHSLADRRRPGTGLGSRGFAAAVL